MNLLRQLSQATRAVSMRMLATLCIAMLSLTLSAESYAAVSLPLTSTTLRGQYTQVGSVFALANGQYWKVIEGGFSWPSSTETVVVYQDGPYTYMSFQSNGGLVKVSLMSTPPTVSTTLRGQYTDVGSIFTLANGQVWKVISGSFSWSSMTETVMLYQDGADTYMSFQSYGGVVKVSQLTTDPIVSTTLRGQYTQVGSVFALANGQYWKVIEGGFSWPSSTETVVVYQDDLYTYMSFQSNGGLVKVSLMTTPPTVSTTLRGQYTQVGSVFALANGQYWKVTSGSFSWSSMTETVMLYQDGADMYMSFQSYGGVVKVSQLTTDPIVSTTLRGQYTDVGSIFILANGQYWKVTSGSFSWPSMKETVMLYQDGADTRMSFQSYGGWVKVVLLSGDIGTTTTSSSSTTTTVASTTTTTQAPTTIALNLAQGWNLLGNGTYQILSVASLFGDPLAVTTVWKWDTAKLGWQFYTPSMDAPALQTYVTEKGYGVLSVINPGEGFWVNANQSFTKTLSNGTTVTAVSFQDGKPGALKQGWNLVAIGNNRTPSGFNGDISASPPTAGVVPQNITTLWAWDNSLSKWYFYAPNLDAQGGTALTDYITSKGYLDFTAASKTLGPGVGFWVNKP